MRAEVLIPRSSWRLTDRASLYSYTVPPHLADQIQPGQLVAVPFGERETAGVIWSLDSSDDTEGQDIDGADDETFPLRAISSHLLDEPALSPVQRALAQWMSSYYAAPLATAARLMLPPGLVRGIRYTLRPTGAEPVEYLPPDAAMLLAMLQERRAVEREQVSEAIGMARARRAIRALLDADLAVVAPEPPASYARARRERLVSLIGDGETLGRWRGAARARLSEPVLPGVRGGSRSRRKSGPEQAAERILGQLATLDALERNAVSRPAWKIEELQRLTRITTAGLAELADAGLIVIEEVAARRDPLAGRKYPRTQPLPLTAAQSAALSEILASAESGGGTFLLHGVTGSGKTEVYLQALAALIARGKRGIALVPEIALTPQAVARYAGRFPGRIALLHSGLTDGERLDEWRRIRAGDVDVVVGSRSALFAPVEGLGLIIVDEEHEGAYKEERTPTYHARDVASQLGALTGATVILGSATPSAESYWRARQGIYKLIELRERVPIARVSNGDEPDSAQLPDVTLIDLRAELRSGHTSILSEALQEALAETLARGEQAILFLNRRGTATSVVCRECGFVARCIRCDVAMTYHATEATLLCHYCGRHEAPPRFCPVCGSASIRYFGVGSERVESAVKRQFPTARVLRWDRDTAKTRLAHEQLSQAFAERRADVLVGTQMIAKGLDLPAVTLVGVVSADIALFLPDFRASERAFQLLTQVAGRAGRGERPGQVLVQTFNPEHFCIQAAARHDYGVFMEAELSARERYDYPPFRRFVKFTFEHADRYTAQIEATALAGRLERLIADLASDQADIVGPAPALLERLRGHYRWHVILRAPDPLPILHDLTSEDLPPGWSVDVDPTSSV